MSTNSNKDEHFIYVILTDENQVLYITNSANEAYAVKDEWETTHAAEAILVECSWMPEMEGWRPDYPPESEINWPVNYEE